MSDSSAVCLVCFAALRILVSVAVCVCGWPLERLHGGVLVCCRVVVIFFFFFLNCVLKSVCCGGCESLVLFFFSL